MAMLAGASIIYGPGMLESGVTFDLAQLVADNELVAMTRYCRRGITVNDDTTLLDEIAAVGPAGLFLDRESTYKGMRGLSTTKIIDRRSYPAWEEVGSPDYYETAKKEAKRTLAEHEVQPLSDEAAHEIEAIVDKAEREMGTG
jgi:trimethylamine--corrinoid protein Co-methyltransferase